jgi:hypothetical protein
MYSAASKGQRRDTISSTEIDTITTAAGQAETPDSSYQRLRDSISVLRSTNKQNAAIISNLLQARELSNRSKYQLVKGNIVSSVEVYRRLNEAVNGLMSGFISDSLNAFVDNLNNPSNGELGTPFNKRVIDLVKVVILRGRSGGKRNKRIISAVTSMVNDSLFDSDAKISPPVEIISSIMTFIKTTAIDDKRISQRRISELEQKLNKYVAYYSTISSAKQQFNYGLSVVKDQLTTLQKNIYVQLSFISRSLNLPIGTWITPEQLTLASNSFFEKFTKSFLQAYLQQLEQKYTLPGTEKIDYQQLLRENLQIIEINNQLDNLILHIKKFESIDDAYFFLLDNYYAQTSIALNMAADSVLVRMPYIIRKQKALSKLKANEENRIRSAINLKDLITNTPYIKYRYKVF